MNPAPGRPQYLETAYSALDIGPNGLPMPPDAIPGGKPAAGQNSPPPSPATSDPVMDFRAAMRGGPIRAEKVDSDPIRTEKVSPETTDALIQAVAKVHRVVTARIKYHESEAARLKASLAPFATLASPGAPPSSQPTHASAIETLVELVKNLPDPPEATP